MNHDTNHGPARLQRSLWLMLPALGVALVLQGCPASGVYRTARTLNEGESDYGLTFTATRWTTAAQVETHPDGKKTEIPSESITVPNPIPEVHGHIGIADNMELGGRSALLSGLMEVDFKYRFIGGPNEKLHVAVQPALGYRAGIGSEGPQFTLPLIATYDFASRFSVTLAPYGSYYNLKNLEDDADSPLSGESLTAGIVIGAEVRGDVFHIMPSIDISQTAVRFEKSTTTEAGKVQTAIDDNLTFMIFGLTFGWTQGKELQKLEKMDTKLDRIEKKLDSDSGQGRSGRK